MALRSWRSIQLQQKKRRQKIIVYAVIFLIVIIFWPRGERKVSEPKVEAPTVDENFIVFIHPGDGGDELGAVYPQNSKSPEIVGKDLNLTIAEAVQRALTKEGVNSILSRQSDVFVNALERKEKAEQIGADLSIAIYINEYYNDPLYTGFEIIDYKKVDWSQNYKQRVAFSRELETALTERLNSFDVTSRGVFTRNSAFVIDAPTIVILPGFISNDAERTRIIDEEYQWQVANAVTDAVILYRDDLRWRSDEGFSEEAEEVTDRLYLPF